MNIELPYNPAIPLLEELKELKAGTPTSIWTSMLSTTLFTFAEKWKQSKCPFLNEWINNVIFMYDGIFCIKTE